MELDVFLDKLLDNLLDKEGIESVKASIKCNMYANFKDYNTAKVEFQVFNGNDNYEPQVVISSEGYSDGEVIFIDCYLD